MAWDAFFEEPPPDGPRRRGDGGRAVVVAAAVGASLLGLFVAWRWSGPSPMLWIDTSNDLAAVHQCLERGLCTGTGPAASVRGLFQSSGWHEVLTFLVWAGLSPDAIHRILMVAFAAVFPLTFLAAFRLGGPWAAGSSMILLPWMLSNAARQDVIYNSRPLPLLGALVLVLSIDAVRRRDVRVLVGATLAAALTANLYLSHAMLLASMACLAFAARRDRRAGNRNLVLVVTLFVLILLIDAPRMWWLNARYVMGVEGATGPAGEYGRGLRFLGEPVWILSVLSAVVPLAASGGRASSAMLRERAIPAILILPSLALFTFAVALGAVQMNFKYLAALMPAVAVGLGLSVALVVRWAAAWCGERRISAVRVAGWLLVVASLPVSATVSGWLNAWQAQDTRGSRRLSYADAAVLGRVLAEDYGYGLHDALWSIRGPVRRELLMALDALNVLDETATDAPRIERLTVLQVPSDRLREVPFPNWRVLRRSGDNALLLIRQDARLDWGEMRYCIDGDSGPDIPAGCGVSALVPKEPLDGSAFLSRLLLPVGRVSPTADFTVTVDVPLLLPDGAGAQAFLLPMMKHQCVGRFARVPPGSEASADGRRVVVHPSGEGAAPVLRVVLHVGGRYCPSYAYSGDLPFILAGSPEQVDFAARLLSDRAVPH